MTPRGHELAGARLELTRADGHDEPMAADQLAAARHGAQPGARAGSDELLTAAEVAGLLRVTKAWVYAETRRGALPHVRLGRYVRYRRAAIVAWVVDIERGGCC